MAQAALTLGVGNLPADVRQLLGRRQLLAMQVIAQIESLHGIDRDLLVLLPGLEPEQAQALLASLELGDELIVESLVVAEEKGAARG